MSAGGHFLDRRIISFERSKERLAHLRWVATIWPQQDKPHLFRPVRRGPADFFDGVHQLLHVRFELFQRGRLPGGRDARAALFERRRHAVAEECDRRFHQRNLFLHMLQPFFLRFVPVETRARPAHRRVGGPGEVAKGDVAVGKCGSQTRFDVAIVHFALEERVADEQHAVAVLQFKRFGRGGARRQPEGGEQCETGEQASR